MQLPLPLTSASPSSGRGGARPGAGRPRKQGSESHRRRPTVSAAIPQHVSLRVAAGVWNLRADRCFRPVRRALAAAQRPAFRIVHYSVQGNHVHLLVEAADRGALSTGLRSIAVGLAKALQRVMGRRGRVLASRTHARPLHTPTEVKNALRYVLLNHARHFPEGYTRGLWVDECSTAPWFADWAALGVSQPRARSRPPAERVDAPPRSWLLSAGYRRGR